MLDIKYWCVLGGEIGQVRREILVSVVSHSVMSRGLSGVVTREQQLAEV